MVQTGVRTSAQKKCRLSLVFSSWILIPGGVGGGGEGGGGGGEVEGGGGKIFSDTPNVTLPPHAALHSLSS